MSNPSGGGQSAPYAGNQNMNWNQGGYQPGAGYQPGGYAPTSNQWSSPAQSVFGRQPFNSWNAMQYGPLTTGTGTTEQNMQAGQQMAPGSPGIGNQLGWFLNMPQNSDPGFYQRWNWQRAMNPAGPGRIPRYSHAGRSAARWRARCTSGRCASCSAPSAQAPVGVRKTLEGMPAWGGATPLNYSDRLARDQAYRASQGRGGQLGLDALADWTKKTGETFGSTAGQNNYGRNLGAPNIPSQGDITQQPTPTAPPPAAAPPPVAQAPAAPFRRRNSSRSSSSPARCRRAATTAATTVTTRRT